VDQHALMEINLPVLMEQRNLHVQMEIGQFVQMEPFLEDLGPGQFVVMEVFLSVLMEETLLVHHVRMETDQSVEMERPGHLVLMETNQHVLMELNLVNLLVRMETCQSAQMEQLQGNLVEDSVKMEPNHFVLMETALYVLMAHRLPHVQMELVLSA